MIAQKRASHLAVGRFFVEANIERSILTQKKTDAIIGLFACANQHLAF